MRNIEVQAVTTAVVSGLMELWRDTWTSTYGPSLGLDALNSMLADLDQQGITTMIPGNGELAYCAVSEGQVVGSAIFAERNGAAYLWGMYVRPEHQRHGVGSRLLAESAEKMVLERVEVRVLSTSPQAIAFYKKQGFKLVGEETTEVMSVPIKTLVLAASTADILRLSQK